MNFVNGPMSLLHHCDDAISPGTSDLMVQLFERSPIDRQKRHTGSYVRSSAPPAQPKFELELGLDGN